MSLIAGIEHPVGPNESLRTLESGKRVLARDSFGRGTRLSILVTEETDWLRLDSVLQALNPRRAFDELMVWIGSHTNMTWTRAEMQRMKLTKQGKSIVGVKDRNEALWVASRHVSSTEVPLPLPRVSLGRSILVASLSSADLLEHHLDDLRELADRALSPSRALIERVLDQRGFLAYEVRDNFNRPVLVMISAADDAALPLEVFDQVFRGGEAGQVFQKGPS